MIHGLLLLFLVIRPGIDPPFVLPALPEPCLEREAYTTGTYLEEQVRIEIEGGTLAGRLFLPNREGLHPAVVVLPGGGRSPRLRHTSRFIAARLARCGVAALFYDKRGTGASDGSWERATYDDLIEDAEAALRLLIRHGAVDTARVGLVGLSQGGRLAPVVAARNGMVAFVVSTSAPFVSLRETRRYALDSFARQRSYANRWHEALLSVWDDFFSLVEAGLPTTPLDHRIERLAAYLPARLLPPLSHQYTGEPLFNSLGRDYLGALGEVTVPLLALYGEEDQVVPVAASIERLREALPPDASLEVLLVPGVDHAFTYAAAGLPRFRFEEVITNWILRQAGLPGECPPLRMPTTADRGAMLDAALIVTGIPCEADGSPGG